MVRETDHTPRPKEDETLEELPVCHNHSKPIIATGLLKIPVIDKEGNRVIRERYLCTNCKRDGIAPLEPGDKLNGEPKFIDFRKPGNLGNL